MVETSETSETSGTMPDPPDSEIFECPSCEETFDTEHGMKVHHTQGHGESLVQIGCECNHCGEEFTEFKSKVERGRGKFCSKECQHQVGRTAVTCEACGETIDRPKHRANRYSREYCSRECYLELKREGGEEAPGWIDGRFSDPDYHRNYNKTFLENREKALERDDYQCQGCGMANEEHIDQYGAELHVHHIQPVTTFDVVSDAHNVENLVALCLQCHRKWEGIPLRPEGSA